MEICSRKLWSSSAAWRSEGEASAAIRMATKMAITMAIRVRLDDRIGFNFNDLMVTESMLPEEQ